MRHPDLSLGGASAVESYWAKIAGARLGLPANQLASFFSDFMHGGNLKFTSLAGAPVQNASPTKDGGHVSISAPAGATHAISAANVGAVGPAHAADMKNSKWFLASRFKLSAIGNVANSLCGIGLSDFATQTWALGYNHAASTTKWSASFNGTNVLSAVNIDAAMHIFTAWSDAARVYVSVDGEAPASAANTTMWNIVAQIILYNATGAAGTTQTMVTDYMGIWTPSTGT